MLSRRCCGAALVLIAFALALAWSGSARAGYIVQPASGATSGPQPTFLVYLDSQDSLARVYVASTPTMDAYGFPSNEVGSCVPSTPFSEVNKYTCQPSVYYTSFSSSLAPGTYFWWMTYWRVDPDHPYGSQQISGPYQFTVAQPVAPLDTYLVSPADGVAVAAVPRVTVHAQAGAQMQFYVSDSNIRLSDNSPAGTSVASCSGVAASTGDWYCQPDPGTLVDGQTYYWWVIVTVNGTPWLYGPRSFTYQASPAGGGSGGGGSVGPPQAHNLSYAPYLQTSAHFQGKSVKQTRLTRAAYGLSKELGIPKTVAVACWSPLDWANISGDNPESAYSILGLWTPTLPRWVNLSPSICRTFETLIYHRPAYTNVRTADALDTLTHEMIHALGVRGEARTECLAMQLSFVTGWKMGLPLQYAENLDRLSLRNYFSHPPRYIDTARCREDGAWDIFKGKASLPWHMPSV